jgi:hypothetical protein
MAVGCHREVRGGLRLPVLADDVRQAVNEVRVLRVVVRGRDDGSRDNWRCGLGERPGAVKRQGLISNEKPRRVRAGLW